MSTQKGDNLLEVNVAARRLVLSVPTIYRLIKKGELKAHKYGGSYKISEHDLDEYRNRYYQPS
jgi:excisionase family DNA binding protein